jgi:hypothetical protein
MASYTLNEEAVRHAESLIKARQYVLDSDWGEAQPTLKARTPTSISAPERSTDRGI